MNQGSTITSCRVVRHHGHSHPGDDNSELAKS